MEHFEGACRLMPDDVPLLTVAAWLEERTALAPVSWEVRRGVEAATADKRIFLEKAAAHALAAVKVDAAAVEPALRLGRIRLLRHDAGGAREILDRLASRSDLSAPQAYLAQLFMGRAVERSGNAARAADLYREAVALMPSAQSARMALASLLYGQEDAAAAADIIAPSLEGDAGAVATDPWTDYLVGDLERGPSLREQLRKEVQR